MLVHVRIDQCGVDSILDRNIDARSSSTAHHERATVHCSVTHSLRLKKDVDRHTFRAPHFLMHSRCTDRSLVCTVRSRITRGSKHKIGVHLCVPHKTLHPLRAMSHTLQHSTPCTGTPSSHLPVQRSEQHCHDPRPQRRGTSVELPPPTGYEPNQNGED